MKKISFIVPVYNTEKYLKKCIESIINQSYKNIEIIIINDGSRDKSKEIIQEYVNNYDFIFSFNKENGGLSDARNFGVTKVTGDYILFVDSDDFIDKYLVEKCLNYIESDYDLVKFKTIKVNEKYEQIEKIGGPCFENKNGEEAFLALYDNDVMMQPAWLYFYKIEFWNKNKFEYPVGKIHEDFARTALIILKAKKVASIDFYGYFYVQSKKSITRGNNEEKVFKSAMDMIDHYDYMLEKIKEYEINDYVKSVLKIYYTNCILLKVLELNSENQKKYIIEIRKRKIINNIKATNFKQLLKRIILKINIKWYLKLR